MARYRESLPQRSGRLFLTDGGIETTLIFNEGLDLPDFAAFHLLKTAEGEAALRKYFRTYAELARSFTAGLVLESATWRANADWGTRFYDSAQLAEANRKAIRLLEEVRDAYKSERTTIVMRGCVGPRGDGYVPTAAMSAPEAEATVPFFRSVRRFGGRHGLRDHDELRGGGHRHRAGGPSNRHPGRDLVHRRDRRPPPRRVSR